MPKLKLHGGAIDVGDLGPRQVRGIPTTKAACSPIAVGQFCRNGQSASAQYWNLVHESTNSAVVFRTREIARLGGILGTGAGLSVSSAAGTRARWRAAGRTSPYHHALLCRMVMHPQSSGFTSPSAAKVEVFSDATESTLIASTTMYYGASPTGTSALSGWPYLKHSDQYITGIDPDTDVFLKISDVDYGLVQSISIADLTSMTEQAGGYLTQTLNSDSEVLSNYRSKVAEIQEDLCKRAGARLLSYSVDLQSSPRTFAAATATNIIDGSSTTVSDATPGEYLDLRGKARRGQSGVPVILKVYCSTTSPTGSGRIYLKSSTGTALQITNTIPLSGAPAWISVTGTLPATLTKYDLQADNNSSSTLSIHAATMWQHE